jgi:iron complex transport system ATP-binding protein
MLQVQDLSVTLDGRAVLQGVGFTARAGTVTVIIGPNGAGKTTLLRALTGDIPCAGRVRLNGHDPARTPAARMAAIRAVLAQSTQVAFPFTVAEIVRLGCEAGTGPADRDLARRVLAEVGLPGYGPRAYQMLSGGEQARVQLARVLAQARQPVTPDGPGWLFLDEPVANLDLSCQTLAIRLARRFADAGGGVLMVLHDLNLAAMAAHQVLLVAGGSLRAAGRPEAVLTDAVLSPAYGCGVRMNRLPDAGPWFLPQSLRDSAA